MTLGEFLEMVEGEDLSKKLCISVDGSPTVEVNEVDTNARDRSGPDADFDTYYISLTN